MRTCLNYCSCKMSMKLGLLRRIPACRTAVPRTGMEHALASALRLHSCALAMCVTLLKLQASSHVHVHELHSAESQCMRPMRRQRRIMNMYNTRMTRAGANWKVTSLLCFAFCSSFCAVLPRNVSKRWLRLAPECLHCLVFQFGTVKWTVCDHWSHFMYMYHVMSVNSTVPELFANGVYSSKWLTDT